MRSLPLHSRILASARAHSGLCSQIERASRGAVILVYHSIAPCSPPGPRGAYCLDTATLAGHLRFLRRRRQVVPLAAIVAAVKAGAEPDRGWVALTFDDALRCQTGLAAEILADHGMPWSLAVPAGLVDRGRSVWTYELAFLLLNCWERATLRLPGDGDRVWPTDSLRARIDTLKALKELLMGGRSPADRQVSLDALICEFGEAAFRERFEQEGTYAIATWAGLRRLADAGVEMLSHGMDHAQHTVLLSDEELRRDLTCSRARITEMVRSVPAGYALPGGLGGERSSRAVAAAGYEFCLTTRTGRVCAPAPLFALPRIDAEYPLSVLRWHMLAR